jgi:competence ComEA-like helix-hairpin-helix protein
MTLYTRPQLAVLVAVVAVAGIGLAVGHWRRLHPELAERLETFDGGSSPSDERTRGGLAIAVPPAKLDDSAALLDVNRASALDLAQLPGVGPALAARIVTARERDGPFTTVEDLRRVRGLGRVTFDRLRALVTAEPAGDASSPVTVPSASVTGAGTE